MKQLILVRRDLKMGKGKMAAQVAHASMGAMLDGMNRTFDGFEFRLTHPELRIWLEGAFTKIVLWVDSEQELLELATKAKSQGYMSALIRDNGLTEFNEVHTYTTVGIGPFEDSDYPEFCKELKLA